jgi:hypothetical protein
VRSVVLALLACLVTLGVPDAARAQETRDLTKLGLEELMALDVVSVNVLGTHVHQAGQWMLSYRFMFEEMSGNRDGSHDVTLTRVLNQFEMAPTKMRMQMHMPMLMYAPSNDLTLMAMLPYIVKSMDHVMRDGVRFRERSEGIGDLEVHALYTVRAVQRYRHRFILNGGVGFPTGSIDEKDFGPDRSTGRTRLEYPMQLGSGTFDLLPGVTYLGLAEDWAWGAEFIPTVRLGRNDNEYRLGNRYRLTSWLHRKVTEWLSFSGTVDAQRWENITGADPTLRPTEEPTKDPKRQAGKRVDLSLGLNLYAPKGWLKGHRLALEGGVPIYQSFDGPQLQTEWEVRAGWQWVFSP